MLGRLLKWGLAGAVALGVAGTVALMAVSRSTPVPEGLGVRDGRLAPCPDSPNCVSTQADPADRQHAIAPIPQTLPAAEAQRRIRELLAAEPRAEILRDEPGYLHAVFRSPTIGFPDDVEFAIDEAAGLIHFRSAARLGRDDLGVNRERMEQLRAALAGI